MKNEKASDAVKESSKTFHETKEEAAKTVYKTKEKAKTDHEIKEEAETVHKVKDKGLYLGVKEELSEEDEDSTP